MASVDGGMGEVTLRQGAHFFFTLARMIHFLLEWGRVSVVGNNVGGCMTQGRMRRGANFFPIRISGVPRIKEPNHKSILQTLELFFNQTHNADNSVK